MRKQCHGVLITVSQALGAWGTLKRQPYVPSHVGRHLLLRRMGTPSFQGPRHVSSHSSTRVGGAMIDVIESAAQHAGSAALHA